MARSAQRVRAYAERFHESLNAGLVLEEVLLALADACKRAIEDQTPPNSQRRQRKIAFYTRCVEVLDEAAAKIKEAS